MTEHDRRELFIALAEVARRYPHWRIGQLVANVAGWADSVVWDVEDAELLSAARYHLTASGALEEAGPSPQDHISPVNSQRT
jgi:hypothetical protein